MRFLALCKPVLAGLAAAAAAAGYLVVAPHRPAGAVWAGLGTLLLAAGAAALNQYQEREIDRRMDRTRDRPIPSGLVRPELALVFSALLLGAGLVVLSRGGTRPVLLGALAAAWYNGVYTPLKRISPMAVVPGSLSGALAPAVGAAFAGARFDDPRVLLLALLLFIWQIPHFWLIVLDRVREFREAGLPNLLDVLSETQARRVVVHWVLGTAAASLVVAGWGAVVFPATRWAVLALSLWLAGRALWFRASPLRLERSLFRTMNIHMAMLLLAIAVDRLFL
jgi:protoheme IX farnesyltransferase